MDCWKVFIAAKVEPGAGRAQARVLRWPLARRRGNLAIAMGTETERKFLVRGDSWRVAVCGQHVLRQGYLAIDGATAVRVRSDGGEAWITIKGPPEGISRPEFEYRIPATDAEAMLLLCRGRVVEKTRYRVADGGRLWEVDVFSGQNEGLTLAELELGRADEEFVRPEWLGQEVSGDPRYLNATLSTEPYQTWAARR